MRWDVIIEHPWSTSEGVVSVAVAHCFVDVAGVERSLCGRVELGEATRFYTGGSIDRRCAECDHHSEGKDNATTQA